MSDIIENLEDLPIRSSLRPKKVWVGEYRYVYPYKRIDRWLRSKVGEKWIDIVSKYIHLDFIAARFRTLSRISEMVYTNTFLSLINNQIYYYDKYCSNEPNKISDASDIFYVSPLNFELCYQPKQKRIDYKKRQADKQAEWCRILDNYNQLIKIEGIWFKISISQERINNYTRFWGGKWNYTKPFTQINYYSKSYFNKKQLNKSELKKYNLRNNLAGN